MKQFILLISIFHHTYFPPPKMKDIFILLSLATATATLASLPTVAVDSLGTVTGAISKLSDTVAVYHAIPYAKPPTDKLRWQPPVEYGAF